MNRSELAELQNQFTSEAFKYIRELEHERDRFDAFVLQHEHCLVPKDKVLVEFKDIIPGDQIEAIFHAGSYRRTVTGRVHCIYLEDHDLHFVGFGERCYFREDNWIFYRIIEPAINKDFSEAKRADFPNSGVTDRWAKESDYEPYIDAEWSALTGRGSDEFIETTFKKVPGNDTVEMAEDEVSAGLNEYPCQSTYQRIKCVLTEGHEMPHGGGIGEGQYQWWDEGSDGYLRRADSLPPDYRCTSVGPNGSTCDLEDGHKPPAHYFNRVDGYTVWDGSIDYETEVSHHIPDGMIVPCTSIRNGSPCNLYQGHKGLHSNFMMDMIWMADSVTGEVSE